MSQTSAQLISGTATQAATFNTVTCNSATIGTLNNPSVTSLNGGPVSGFRNRLINAAFNIDQRNNGALLSSGLATVTYTVDRWYVYASGAAVTAQQISYAPPEFPNALKITGAASNTGASIGQRIESQNSYDMAGKTVTLSFYASSASSISLGWTVSYASTTDNFTTKTLSNSGTVGITTTPTKYSVTFALSSLATTGLAIEFSPGALTSGFFTVTGAQLEIGTAATPLERRSYGHELALCQRYCYISSPANLIGYSQSTTSALFGKSLPVYMRATPTIALSGTGTVVYGGGSTTTSSTYSSDSCSPDNLGFFVTTSAVLTAGQAVRLQTGTKIIATAEL
jgi:hypothetical protein